MTSTLIDHRALFIDGQWQQPHSTARIEVLSVNTERQIGSVPNPDDVDIDRAVAAARTAFHDPSGWSNWTMADRARVLHAFADAYLSRASRIAELVSDQNGMPLSLSSTAEAYFPADVLRYYADIAGDHRIHETRAGSDSSSGPRRCSSTSATAPPTSDRSPFDRLAGTIMKTFATRPSFTTPEHQPVLSFLGSPERLLLAGQDTGGEFALFESTGHRGHSAPTHRHLHASETFIVLDGDVLIQVGGERRVAGAGDTAVLPRGLPHTFVVLSPTARYMTLHTPAGFEAFVHAVSGLAAGGAAPDRAALVATAAEHGIEILGPGLPLPEGT